MLVKYGDIVKEGDKDTVEMNEAVKSHSNSNSKKAVVGASVGVVAALAVAGTVSAVKSRKTAAKDEEDDKTAETELAENVV